MLPDGRAIETVPQAEMNTILAKLGIVGFSHSNGLATNIALYQAHLNHVAAVAGRKAVDRWLAAHR